MNDLSKMSITEMRALQEQLAQEMKKREQEEIARAREQIQAIAKSVGLPLRELFAEGKGETGKAGKSRSGAATQYRHPQNATLQWSGRGRQPQWIKEWLASGQSLDTLRS